MKRLANILLLSSAFIALFFGANVLNFLGYKIGEETAPTIQKIFPSFYLVVLCFIIISINTKFSALYRHKKIEFIFIFYIIILIAFLSYCETLGAISFIPNTLILPILFSICINQRNFYQLHQLKQLLISFYIINSLIAIVEQARSFHFFEGNIENLDFYGFRSTALQDHPLNNAFITSTIMVFILFSDINIYKKYALYSLGFFSIVCYGSRSSLIICSFILIAFFFYNLFSRTTVSKKLSTIVFLIIGVFGGSYLILDSSFGERLANKLYFDESASVRLNLFDIFDMIHFDNLLWGNSNESIEKLNAAVGISTIENFWVAWILRFGLITSPILIFIFIKFILNKIATYPSTNKAIIAVTLLGIASTNNSLASNTAAISVFVLCSYAFSIERSKQSVKRQLLSTRLNQRGNLRSANLNPQTSLTYTNKV